MGRADTLRIEVVFSPAARAVAARWVELPAGSMLVDALRASGLPESCGAPIESLTVAVWGCSKALNTPLREGDRVELVRGLEVDPKEARRLRYKRQRSPVAPGKKPL